MKRKERKRFYEIIIFSFTFLSLKKYFANYIFLFLHEFNNDVSPLFFILISIP